MGRGYGTNGEFCPNKYTWHHRVRSPYIKGKSDWPRCRQPTQVIGLSGNTALYMGFLFFFLHLLSLLPPPSSFFTDTEAMSVSAWCSTSSITPDGLRSAISLSTDSTGALWNGLLRFQWLGLRNKDQDDATCRPRRRPDTRHQPGAARLLHSSAYYEESLSSIALVGVAIEVCEVQGEFDWLRTCFYVYNRWYDLFTGLDVGKIN